MVLPAGMSLALGGYRHREGDLVEEDVGRDQRCSTLCCSLGQKWRPSN